MTSALRGAELISFLVSNKGQQSWRTSENKSALPFGSDIFNPTSSTATPAKHILKLREICVTRRREWRKAASHAAGLWRLPRRCSAFSCFFCSLRYERNRPSIMWCAVNVEFANTDSSLSALHQVFSRDWWGQSFSSSSCMGGITSHQITRCAIVIWNLCSNLNRI